MDKQSLLNKISFILQDLKSQHLKLTGNVDRIPEIDLDLFLANASFLVNHLEVLKKINGSSPEVKERDDILKNLFNSKELENLMDSPDEDSVVPPKNFPKERKDQSIEIESAKINEEFLPHEDPTIPQNTEFRNQESLPEIPSVNPSFKTRNESFLETQNNFVLPFSNKQGVFAPELERKAAYFAERTEEPEPQNLDKRNSETQNLDKKVEKTGTSTLNDSFHQELKALRELNYKIENGLNPDSNSSSGMNSHPVPGMNTSSRDMDNRKDSHSSNDFNSAQKREPSLLNKLGNLPVKDIRKAIGLNEHLLFIKTLFHGDPAIYDRTLSMIDTFNSSEQAFQFLQDEISVPYNWDSKKAVAELFKNIVNRKFAGNR
jgi:hypothetical protein